MSGKGDFSMMSALDMLSYQKSDDDDEEMVTAKSASTSVSDRSSSISFKEFIRTLADPFKYPKGVFFCLACEFAEKFAFYGLRVTLILHMVYVHNIEEPKAKFVYHSFGALVYFTPLIGSILSDGFLGKYVVIVCLTLIYCIGHGLTLMSAFPSQIGADAVLPLYFMGLFTIAIGVGGAKPCMYAFISDQFPPTIAKERKKFSSLFYFCISAAALTAEFALPLLRKVNCLGDSCYPLVFGLLMAFVVVGLLIFVSGQRFYIVAKFEDNTTLQIIGCTCYALTHCSCRRWCSQRTWLSFLDSAKSKYGEHFVEDVKSVYHILLMFTPAIAFWALYDQQGSTWVLQASRMNGHFGSMTMLPSQVLLLNPLFSIILIPLFAFVIYPLLWKHNCCVRPLRRMVYGCVFAALSFIAAGVVHLFINQTLIKLPSADKSRFYVVNMGKCALNVTFTGSSMMVEGFKYEIGDHHSLLTIESVQCSLNKSFKWNKNWRKQSSPRYASLFTCFFDIASCEIWTFRLRKTRKGESIFHTTFHSNINSSISVELRRFDDGDPDYVIRPTTHNISVFPSLIGTTMYKVVLTYCDKKDICIRKLIRETSIENGGVYALIIGKDYDFQFITVIEPNQVTMAWMIPQFFLLTIGEILFAHSGSEFSYAQAAPSMKSTMQSCWLLSVAFGNNLDMVVSYTRLFADAAIEYFFYAGVMVVFTAIFVYLTFGYTYIERDKIEAARLEDERKKEFVAARKAKSKGHSRKVDSSKRKKGEDHRHEHQIYAEVD